MLVVGRRFALASMGLLAVGVRAAHAAEEVTLRRSADLPTRPYAGLLDVRGVRIGMPFGEARAVVVQEYGSAVKVDYTRLQVQHRGVEVQSERYPAVIEAEALDDRMMVTLGTPAVGGVVTAIRRTVTFPDPVTAPRITNLIRQLEEKYGRSSQWRNYNLPESLFWIFDESAQVSEPTCPASYCGVAGEYSPSQVEEHRRAVTNFGQHVRMMATVHGDGRDPFRASSMIVAVEDMATMVQGAREAQGQMEQAAASAYRQRTTAAPQQGPKL